MVKKLLKHEFIYYFRTLSLFLPIVLVIGVMARVFRTLNDANANAETEIRSITEIASFSASAMLFVACAAILILSFVICIVRFYKNMYSAEGYLTFTLPVTNAQHIFVKLLVAMVCQTVCALTVMAAGCIALWGQDLVEIFKVFGDLFGPIFPKFGAVHTVLYIIEGILLVILSAASNMLLYYACITVGQTAKKNRILMAIGAYFIYYIASQAVATVFTIVITVVGMTADLAKLLEWVATHYVAAIHMYLCGMVIFTAVMAAAFWLVTQTIMTKKLNLE